ncbi:hypothetical protein JMJ77_0002708 [Colletotrichum scovillei]|uniref:Uncharacterized protein n=1 Tax=Colletotrichum scovillei TaxID=1209932 RepID=A0A9P7UJS8_9PEZI|nr:hypothetical protein JMJ77_0002708 [Colletotrichum scovillei]KAG7071133.1 hypothetical protein JMJ76_0002370 [Colletotrichum scovillei]KAG7079408.1 hypothetical protein JMJ78_0003061 [Colletotrichum scovillei]
MQRDGCCLNYNVGQRTSCIGAKSIDQQLAKSLFANLMIQSTNVRA